MASTKARGERSEEAEEPQEEQEDQEETAEQEPEQAEDAEEPAEDPAEEDAEEPAEERAGDAEEPAGERAGERAGDADEPAEPEEKPAAPRKKPPIPRKRPAAGAKPAKEKATKEKPVKERPAKETKKAKEVKEPKETQEAKEKERPARKKRRVRRIVTVRVSDPVLAVAAALALAAVIGAAWFGVSWYQAAHDDSVTYSKLRDEVLSSGEQAIQNLNTLDYRNLNQGLKTWQDSSTAELYQQIVQGRGKFEQDVAKAKTVSTAKILDAALTELDDHAGKASIIAAVQITVTPPKGDPVTKRSRLMGQLTKTSAGWKLSALGQAPVGTSGS